MQIESRIEIPCPYCGSRQRRVVRWVRAFESFVCGSCGRQVNLQRDEND